MSFVFLLTVASCFASVKERSRLIAFNESYSEWMSLEEVHALGNPASGVSNFVDITDARPARRTSMSKYLIPTVPRHQTTVNNAVDILCQSGTCYDQVKQIDDALASYFNRFYSTQSGRDAALWLASQYKSLIGHRNDISVQVFEHNFGVQPSVIVTWLGSGQPSETVILGGHIDSTAGGANNAAPGFDDDGSGSSTVFTAFRSLLAADFEPFRTIEFHAYAAEEVGLRGSQAVAQFYDAEGRDVVAMVQFDMTCYSKNFEVGLTNDYTDAELTAFVGACVGEYTKMGTKVSTCGYGCSDHASWQSVGYKSAFPFEAPFGNHNPNIHTNRDTADKCNLDYMGEFAKLAIATAIELSSA